MDGLNHNRDGGAPLEDLQDQERDISSWRTSTHVVTKSQKQPYHIILDGLSHSRDGDAIRSPERLGNGPLIVENVYLCGG